MTRVGAAQMFRLQRRGAAASIIVGTRAGGVVNVVVNVLSAVSFTAFSLADQRAVNVVNVVNVKFQKFSRARARPRAHMRSGARARAWDVIYNVNNVHNVNRTMIKNGNSCERRCER